MPDERQNKEKLLVAKVAVSYVKHNDIVGLGTGSTATLAIRELAKLQNKHFSIIGVPSSIETRKLAISLGIPLQELGETKSIDISIDGADEFTTDLNLIKGGGGALFREKIVASLSKKSIIITDSSKKVKKLGAFKVPVEFNPNAHQYVVGKLQELNGVGMLRMVNDQVFITDNDNYILDVDFGLIDHPENLAGKLNQVEGVLAHGIFVNLISKILMANNGEIIVFQ